jgi:hypothetical protein
MTKTNLQVVEVRPAAPLSPSRAHLADAIAERTGLTAATEALSAARRKLSSLVVAEQKAASGVTALESAATAAALQWAREGDAEAATLPDGADLAEARAVLQKAQPAAAAARGAEPQLMRELQAVLARRAALENSIKAHALDVLGELASEIVERARSFKSERRNDDAWFHAPLSVRQGPIDHETRRMAALRQVVRATGSHGRGRH